MTTISAKSIRLLEEDELDAFLDRCIEHRAESQQAGEESRPYRRVRPLAVRAEEAKRSEKYAFAKISGGAHYATWICTGGSTDYELSVFRGAVTSCTCPDHAQHLTICKHMSILAEDADLELRVDGHLRDAIESGYTAPLKTACAPAKAAAIRPIATFDPSNWK